MNKFKLNRPNDYLYDPLFIVSGEKDYYKAAVTAKLSNANFAIRPIFPSMFSDLPHMPRQVVVARRSSIEPKYTVQRSFVELQTNKQVDVVGHDRHKFFSQPIHVPKKESPSKVHYPLSLHLPTKKIKKKRNKLIQTQYRESSAQTIPWQPDNYVVADEGETELLMLDFLKWGSGLPCGIHEAKLIERARMKRAWEKSLPPITDAASLQKRRQIMEAIARDEWAFREQEIKDIHELRMELLVKMINEINRKSKNRSEKKLRSFYKIKMAETERKLKLLRHNAERELRKLEVKRRNINKTYWSVDIIEEHSNKKSELYAPLMRHGENPKRWHQVIDDHTKIYKDQFLGAEKIDTLPRWIDEGTLIREADIKLPGTQLCLKETKWTSPVLKELHEELKNLRTKQKRHCTLMIKIIGKSAELKTPEVEVGDDDEENLHQASVLIQSFLRGRASQVLIYEGRDRCRQLIHELRSTHALQEQEKEKIFYKRLEVKSQQREYTICTNNVTLVKESLKQLSGNVVGTLLDFLNKELRRLIDERKIHAMCLMFERERHFREAAEAGRRQVELRRRLELDEMFKQIAKVNQDTVDLYLEDIITEGMDFTSKFEARCYVKKLANSIDEKMYASLKTQNYFEEEELIANLLHNFLLPEVEKQILRKKIKKKQEIYLKTVHNTIYDHCATLPKAEPKLTELERKFMRNKRTILDKSHTFKGTSTADDTESSDNGVHILFSATQIGFKDFEEVSNIHPAMETLIDKEDTVSTITSASTFIPLKVGETNLDIDTLEMPLGVSDEILFVNLIAGKNLQ